MPFYLPFDPVPFPYFTTVKLEGRQNETGREFCVHQSWDGRGIGRGREIAFISHRTGRRRGSNGTRTGLMNGALGEEGVIKSERFIDIISGSSLSATRRATVNIRACANGESESLDSLQRGRPRRRRGDRRRRRERSRPSLVSSPPSSAVELIRPK